MPYRLFYFCLLSGLCFRADKTGDILNLLFFKSWENSQNSDFNPKAGQVVDYYNQSSGQSFSLQSLLASDGVLFNNAIYYFVMPDSGWPVACRFTLWFY